jgi:mono/diheme cytochrome c family protein
MMRITIKNTLLMVLVPGVAAFVSTAGCTKQRPELHKQPNIELIQDMMVHDALKPQDFEPGNVDKAASRPPPENTVPVGYKPYPYHLDAAAAAKNLKNPLGGDMGPEVLKVGRVKFETYCAVCHGYEGKGDGPVAPKMVLAPPPVISDKIIGFNDAAIYHIITDGQGVMASYSYQIVDERDRWAIVNYVRSLQKLAKGGSQTAGKDAAGTAGSKIQNAN